MATITDEIVTEKFLEFKPIIDKLHKEGFKSSCRAWWSSRFYDSYLYPGHSLSKRGWEWANFTAKCWEFIWDKYEPYFSKGIMPKNESHILVKPKQIKKELIQLNLF